MRFSCCLLLLLCASPAVLAAPVLYDWDTFATPALGNTVTISVGECVSWEWHNYYGDLQQLASQAAYDSCSFVGATTLAIGGNQGFASFTATEPGTYWFSSSVPDGNTVCPAGKKVQVTVIGEGGFGKQYRVAWNPNADPIFGTSVSISDTVVFEWSHPSSVWQTITNFACTADLATPDFEDSAELLAQGPTGPYEFHPPSTGYFYFRNEAGNQHTDLYECVGIMLNVGNERCNPHSVVKNINWDNWGTVDAAVAITMHVGECIEFFWFGAYSGIYQFDTEEAFNSLDYQQSTERQGAFNSGYHSFTASVIGDVYIGGGGAFPTKTVIIHVEAAVQHEVAWTTPFPIVEDAASISDEMYFYWEGSQDFWKSENALCGGVTFPDAVLLQPNQTGGYVYRPTTYEAPFYTRFSTTANCLNAWVFNAMERCANPPSYSCPSGFVGLNGGLNSPCMPCPQGTYPIGDDCQPCAIDDFNPWFGMGSCMHCYDRSTNNQTGAVACESVYVPDDDYVEEESSSGEGDSGGASAASGDGSSTGEVNDDEDDGGNDDDVIGSSALSLAPLLSTMFLLIAVKVSLGLF